MSADQWTAPPSPIRTNLPEELLIFYTQLLERSLSGHYCRHPIQASANCIVHIYGKKGAATRGGLYDFEFRRGDGALRIARKKITFIDDRLEGPVDIYHL